MNTITLPSKRNQDGSYSVSLPVTEFLNIGFADYYNDATGAGFQRFEPLTRRRGRDIADYILRCKERHIPWRLQEFTCNLRTVASNAQFEQMDGHDGLGRLTLRAESERPLSIIDGGTRFVGLQVAIERDTVGAGDNIDIRLFIGLTLAEEIALFLLINDKQKKVRTDLGLRVVQRALDAGRLKDRDRHVLEVVVPDTDSWKFAASRVTSHLNSDTDSAWRGLIQMPGDLDTKPIKLQAMFTSLKPVLTEDVIRQQGNLDDFVLRNVKTFWGAVATVNPRAAKEPATNVLFGSIGASSCHLAFAQLLANVLSNEPSPQNLSTERLAGLMDGSEVGDYGFWFSRPPSADAQGYPELKGEATIMTGASNYVRLGKALYRQWSKKLYAERKRPGVNPRPPRA